MLAEWVPMLNKLGRIEQLQTIARETHGRRFVSSAAQARVTSTVEAAVRWPREAYRCGTFALYEVLKTLQPDSPALRAILALPAPASGFSLADLTRVAADFKVNLIAVARVQGDELIVPCVVHWQLNHFGAVVDRRGDFFKVIDPIFRTARWMDANSINAESSGYFFIRQ